ncbi:hypothetical protein QKU58_gp051 [Pyramimonas orientalis virus]|uniref:Uncharacterized protein n=1 Tax=Pyramimonas orientalis virus 01B TaxID=3134525 RepID=A0A7L9AYJ2_9VIRU|nr:hypothetical protein QKU58_gp051 [Pyramimonas orientalis virus]QOI90280.1 hypothetical protein HWQ62_00143 [Pyramimonas orientalis virus]
MTIHIESFRELKSNVNNEFYESFNKRFQYILRKFESLSKTNHYKKVQKANIIVVPNASDDTILNLLNKISCQNFEVISQKISLKITEKNILKFVDQIFTYVEKSNANSESLWKLIKLLESHHFANQLTKEIIQAKLKDFFDNFVKLFDVVDNSTQCNTKEEYIDFVERNENNGIIISKMKLIYTILLDVNVFNLTYDVNVLFNIFISRLNKLVNSDNHQNTENITFILLECFSIIIKNRNICGNPYAFKRFLNDFDNDDIKKRMKNKIRFKLMDIIDSIKKHK